MPRQIEVDLKLAGNTEQPYRTGLLVKGVTTTLTKWYPIVALTLQANDTTDGASVVKLPHWSLWPDKYIDVYVEKTAGTGTCQLVDFAGTDVLSDNFSVVGDHAKVYNQGGLTVTKVEEVTT